MDEMVHPDEIEKMSNAVLSIQLPRSPAEIRSMIKDINNLLNGATRFQDDVKELQDEAKIAQELLQKATEIRERTKNSYVKEILRDIFTADRAQSKANDYLEMANQDRDEAKNLIQEVENKVSRTESKLMNWPTGLLEEIEAVKNKTEQNREMAKEAREAAESAFTNISNETELKDVHEQFQLLKQKRLNQTLEDEAADRLKKILKEAEGMQRQMEDRLQQIQGFNNQSKSAHTLLSNIKSDKSGTRLF
ncbi:hypothetical protein ILYODFUR_029996 [Ilyodon furcidens]|uniref:LAMB1/2/3/4 helical domain-containing protein n=1 Tax=Ilyodon furcidens TaxID=33524 RepID=A0ABV0V975_9TELE